MEGVHGRCEERFKGPHLVAQHQRHAAHAAARHAARVEHAAQRVARRRPARLRAGQVRLAVLERHLHRTGGRGL